MDSFTLNTFGIVVPFAIFTLVFGLALGPIADRLARLRKSL